MPQTQVPLPLEWHTGATIAPWSQEVYLVIGRHWRKVASSKSWPPVLCFPTRDVTFEWTQTLLSACSTCWMSSHAITSPCWHLQMTYIKLRWQFLGPLGWKLLLHFLGRAHLLRLWGRVHAFVRSSWVISFLINLGCMGCMHILSEKFQHAIFPRDKGSCASPRQYVKLHWLSWTVTVLNVGSSCDQCAICGSAICTYIGSGMAQSFSSHRSHLPGKCWPYISFPLIAK